jgi:hypothetical protein
MIEELIELVCDAVHHVLPRLYHPVLCAHLSENGVHELAPADVSFLFRLTIWGSFPALLIFLLGILFLSMAFVGCIVSIISRALLEAFPLLDVILVHEFIFVLLNDLLNVSGEDILLKLLKPGPMLMIFVDDLLSELGESQVTVSLTFLAELLQNGGILLLSLGVILVLDAEHFNELFLVVEVRVSDVLFLPLGKALEGVL